MAGTHTLLTPTIIAKEALMHLENNLVMGNLVHRQYKNEFQKVGGTITIRKPVKFRVQKTRIRTTGGALTERSITLTVATQAHVTWEFYSVDLTLTIEKYAERYIRPAAAALANAVDADLTDLYKNVYNSVWESTGFITPESFIALGKAAQLMDEEAVPPDDRVMVLNPAANWSLANAMKNMYVTDVSKPALKKGFLAKIANMEIYMDQNIKTHNTGNYFLTGSAHALVLHSTAGTVPSSTGCEATSVGMGGFEVSHSELFYIGDVFTIAGVYAVNPMSGESTGQLRQFVVTAVPSTSESTTAADSGLVHFDPPIIHTGPYKTVDTVPALSAAVTVVGTQGEPYPQNLAFHKNAFALVTVPLEMPAGVWGARETHNGLSIRVLKDYDIEKDSEIIRMDILYGVKTLYPELAVRIWGAEG